MSADFKFDRIGYWSELKLEILKEYASAYSKILSARKNPAFFHAYVDAFAGAGVHLKKHAEGFVPGSPLNALNIHPPFREYFLIDIKSEKIESLKKLIGSREDVHIYRGDCNEILLETVFPQIKYEEYRRALCLLDPYGLNVKWDVIFRAGQMKSIDLFLNFPVEAINRNVLLRDSDKVDPSKAALLTKFWGDESWRRIAYGTNRNLFSFPEKESNAVVAEAFRQRLKDVAGFKRVPDPMPMRNSRRAIVYYLFFASQKDTAEHIVRHIFTKYRDRGA